MKQWLLALSAAAVVMLLLEFLIVGESMQKTVKFALGLLFMLLVLSPIVQLLHAKIDVSAIANEATAKSGWHTNDAVPADYDSVISRAAGGEGEAYGDTQP